MPLQVGRLLQLGRWGGHAAAIVLKHDELKGHLSVVSATDGIGAQTGGGAAAGAAWPPLAEAEELETALVSACHKVIRDGKGTPLGSDYEVSAAPTVYMEPLCEASGFDFGVIVSGSWS